MRLEPGGLHAQSMVAAFPRVGRRLIRLIQIPSAGAQRTDKPIDELDHADIGKTFAFKPLH